MPGFTIIPDEERDLSRYRRSDSNIQQESKPQDSKPSENSSLKFEELMKELDEGLRLIQLEDKKEEERMKKAFEEADRVYENTTRSIHAKYPELENLRSKYPDLKFYLGI